LPSVERWVKEGAKAQPNFTDKHRSGRPRLVPAAKRGSIKRSAARDKSIPEITATYNKHAPQPVSESTIRRTVTAGRDPLAWQHVNRGRVTV
jgi:transposase